VFPSLQILPAPVPRLSFWRARGLNPSSTKSTLATWEAPAVAWFRFVIRKGKNPRNSVGRKHHTGQDQPLPQQPPPEKHPGALLTCSLQSQMLRHHHFCCIRYQETQNYHYAHEKSHTPHSSLLPPQLTSNSCPMPKAASSVTAKLRETPLTQLLHNTLLSHADLTHNCLTFSDLMSAHCSAPPRLCAAPAIKSKQTAHAEILPKTKACLHQSQSPAPVAWLLSHSALAFYGFPGFPEQSSSKATTHRHRPTLHTTPQTMGFKKRKRLLRNHDCWTRDAVAQGDRQGCHGPERGGSTAALENWIRTE